MQTFSCISDKFFKISDYKLLKFHHISKSNTRYCIAHLATLTLFRVMPHLYTHAHTYKHTHTHTQTHTHTHTHTHTDLNYAIFGKISQLNTRAIETILFGKI